jgi:hypothetical protein
MRRRSGKRGMFIPWNVRTKDVDGWEGALIEPLSLKPGLIQP